MNKKKLVKSSSSAKRKPFLSRKMLMTLIVLGALVLIGVWFLATAKAINDDKQRFVKANELKSIVFNELVSEMGQPITKVERKECYNSEQGPYDDGRLWCVVTDAVYYVNEVDEKGIRDSFVNIAESHGLQTRLPDGQTGFHVVGNLACDLYIESGKFANDPGYGFPVIENSKQTIFIRCADRALAKHFQFEDFK
jgi:hypothetical protein